MVKIDDRRAKFSTCAVVISLAQHSEVAYRCCVRTFNPCVDVAVEHVNDVLIYSIKLDYM